MIKHTITSYSFNELLPAAQKKAIENNRDCNIYDCWYESTIENNEEWLESAGFIDSKIDFSGFYSQGDGASFTSKVNISKFLNNFPFLRWAMKKEIIDISGNIFRKTGRYYHEYTTTTEVLYIVSIELLKNKTENRITNAIERNIGLLECEIESKRLKYSKRIYSNLETVYDMLTSDNAVTEYLSTENIQFYDSGVNFNV